MNGNLPKCENCQKLKCDAGLVNHKADQVGRTIKRGVCMLCNCTKFVATDRVAADPERKDA